MNSSPPIGDQAAFEQSVSTPPSTNPVRVSIAQLTDGEIERMDEQDLFTVIEMADIRPVDRELLHSLEFRKTSDLRRIVMATRTACRDYWRRAKLAQTSRSFDAGPGATTTVRIQLH